MESGGREVSKFTEGRGIATRNSTPVSIIAVLESPWGCVDTEQNEPILRPSLYAAESRMDHRPTYIEMLRLGQSALTTRCVRSLDWVKLMLGD